MSTSSPTACCRAMPAAVSCSRVAWYAASSSSPARQRARAARMASVCGSDPMVVVGQGGRCNRSRCSRRPRLMGQPTRARAPLPSPEAASASNRGTPSPHEQPPTADPGDRPPAPKRPVALLSTSAPRGRPPAPGRESFLPSSTADPRELPPAPERIVRPRPAVCPAGEEGGGVRGRRPRPNPPRLSSIAVPTTSPRRALASGSRNLPQLLLGENASRRRTPSGNPVSSRRLHGTCSSEQDGATMSWAVPTLARASSS